MISEPPRKYSQRRRKCKELSLRGNRFEDGGSCPGVAPPFDTDDRGCGTWDTFLDGYPRRKTVPHGRRARKEPRGRGIRGGGPPSPSSVLVRNSPGKTCRWWFQRRSSPRVAVGSPRARFLGSRLRPKPTGAPSRLELVGICIYKSSSTLL